MKLDVKDRLVLQNLLPQEGNFVTLRVIQEARKSLSFTDEELTTICFKQKDTQLSWKTNLTKDITLKPSIREILKLKLKELDDKGTLLEPHIRFYQILVLDHEKEAGK